METDRYFNPSQVASETVTVNPSRTPMGAFYSHEQEGSSSGIAKAAKAAARTLSPIEMQTVNRSAHMHSGIINFIFPTRLTGIGSSLLLAAMRMICSMFFIFNGIEMCEVASGAKLGLWVFVLVAGVLLCAGVLVRPVGIALATVFTIMAFDFGVSQLLLMFAVFSLVLAIAGAGQFSIDHIVRRSLIRSAIRRRRRQIMRRLSYSAYHVDFPEASLS